jgi:hypothetical protein
LKTNSTIPNDIDPELIEVFEPPVEDLVNEFKYRVKPTTDHKRMLELFTIYYENNEKFMTKKVRIAGVRARKALTELRTLCRTRRIEIQKELNSWQKGEFL